MNGHRITNNGPKTDEITNGEDIEEGDHDETAETDAESEDIGKSEQEPPEAPDKEATAGGSPGI